MIDLRNTREEAISVAEPKSNQDEQFKLTNSEKDDKEYLTKLNVKIDDRKSSTSDVPKIYNKNEDVRRSSISSEISMDQEEDDDKEIKYRLDPKLIYDPFSLLLFIIFTVIFLILKINFYCLRYANVRTPERHVRTRLYFTSVSIFFARVLYLNIVIHVN